jgi:hypothetical protein
MRSEIPAIAATHSDSHCAGNIGSRLTGADTDGVGLGRKTKVVDVNIVITCGEKITGELAQEDVPAARKIITGGYAHCDIEIPGFVDSQRVGANGYVQ